MKVQTALLTGKALNWAVQACEFKDLETDHVSNDISFSVTGNRVPTCEHAP